MTRKTSYMLIMSLLLLITVQTQAHSSGLQHAYTTAYPPLSIRKGKSSSGLCCELLKEINKRTKQKAPISFGIWNDVFNKVQKTKDTVVFPTALSSDRRNDFIWVGPICSAEYFVYKSTTTNLSITTKRDILTVKRIATFKGYVLNKTLLEQGCTNLKYYKTPKEAIISVILGKSDLCIFPSFIVDTFHKNSGYTNLTNFKKKSNALSQLLNGENGVTLTYGSSYESYEDINSKNKANALLSKSNNNRPDIEPVIPYLKEHFYFAINKDTPKKTAENMQQALLDIEEDGTLKKLFKKYTVEENSMPEISHAPLYPTPVAANKKMLTTKGEKSDPSNTKLKIYAEDSPPFTFSVGGSKYIQGAVAELISVLYKELGEKQPVIEISDWNTIFNLAKTRPNTVICTIKRLPEREKDFYWIGPYAADSEWLYARRDFLPKIKDLEDAKQIESINCIDETFAYATLNNLGFKNIQGYDKPEEVVLDMMNNPEHAGAFSRIAAPYYIRSAGHSAINVKPLFQLSKKTNYYIGISKSTPKATAVSWQKAFNAVKARGELQRILKRWVKK